MLNSVVFSLRRVLFCGLLFLCANVMKKLLAKLFSSHFYKATHYDKMQDALRKEFCIVALSQPREDREEDDPMKHKPSTLAELRTKSFAAGGALVSPQIPPSSCACVPRTLAVPLCCLFCCSPSDFSLGSSVVHYLHDDQAFEALDFLCLGDACMLILHCLCKLLLLQCLFLVLQLQRLKSVRGPSATSPQLAAQKSFASHSSLTDTDDEEEHQLPQRAHSISNAAVSHISSSSRSFPWFHSTCMACPL